MSFIPNPKPCDNILGERTPHPEPSHTRLHTVILGHMIQPDVVEMMSKYNLEGSQGLQVLHLLNEMESGCVKDPTHPLQDG
jgi:hypothetical protein